MTKKTDTPKRGRPPDREERKQTTSMRLSPIVLEFLREQPESAADVVEDTIRRSKAFRAWLSAK